MSVIGRNLDIWIRRDCFKLVCDKNKFSLGADSGGYCYIYYTSVYSTLVYSTLEHSTLVHSTLVHSTLVYNTLVQSTLVYSTLVYSTLVYNTLVYNTLVYYIHVYVQHTRAQHTRVQHTRVLLSRALFTHVVHVLYTAYTQARVSNVQRPCPHIYIFIIIIFPIVIWSLWSTKFVYIYMLLFNPIKYFNCQKTGTMPVNSILRYYIGSFNANCDAPVGSMRDICLTSIGYSITVSIASVTAYCLTCTIESKVQCCHCYNTINSIFVNKNVFIQVNSFIYMHKYILIE